MTREAKQREQRFIDDIEKLRSQQAQTLGTLDNRMMERRTQALMVRLEFSLKLEADQNKRKHSRYTSKEPIVNFNGPSSRGRTCESTRRGGNPSNNATASDTPSNSLNG